MAERRTIPGGLRAQALIAISLLLGLAFAAGGIVVERIVAQNLLRGARDSAEEIARIVNVSEVSAEQAEQMIRKSPFAGIRRTTDAQAWQVGDWSETKQNSPYAVHVIEAGSRADVLVSRAFIESELERTRKLIWGFLGIGAIVILAFAYAMFTFMVIRPLRAIGVATERAADGDLASPIGLLPRNEFGHVGQSFNSMLQRLENQRAELEKSLEELKAANRELKSTQESLIRSEKLASVGQLAAGVAHEVGNPLAAVSGFNELMLEGDLEESERQELLERSHEQLERIQGIVRSLLDFSREDATVTPRPIALPPVVDESHLLVSALPRARGKTVSIELGDELPEVLGVHAQLGQVLVNLLVNALDAVEGAEEPTVSVTAESHSDRVILIVSDNGPGIAKEHRQRIFDPFFTTKEPGKGTGLGLAICSRIIEGFGGELRLAETESTRFEIVLRRGDL